MIKAANKTLHEMKRNTSGTPIMDSPHAPWPCPPKGPWPNPPNCGSMMGGLGPIFGALAEGLDQGKLESYPASRGVETNVKPNTLWPCPPCGPWPSPPMCSCKKSPPSSPPAGSPDVNSRSDAGDTAVLAKLAVAQLAEKSPSLQGMTFVKLKSHRMTYSTSNGVVLPIMTSLVVETSEGELSLEIDNGPSVPQITKALLKNEIITAPVPLVLRLEAAADPRTPPRPDGPSAASAASLLPVALAAVIAAVLLVARVRRDGSVEPAPRRDELM